MTRRLLLLCHANIARSAAAELIARRLIGTGHAAHVEPEWDVSSAGVRALVGHPIDSEIGDALRRRSISVRGHVARQATPADLRGAQLILAFESAHRSWVLEQEPAVRNRTFTVLRAARVLRRAARRRETPDQAIQALVADARAYTEADDFADPYGLGVEAAETAVERIDELLRIILPMIGSVSADAMPPKARPLPTRRSQRHSAEHVLVGSAGSGER
ncbi:hypothetical protein [Humibacter ginsenosidimutans]|uniref:arsenate reductase/protein-tyrosine-phosphatase family protein n=1 Tax=Humibacter ginsenosidimutans TaxID=2599293 RepID=UPI00143CC699|nr:hypothetical protein [Humibacter ginsenosidimutans]